MAGPSALLPAVVALNLSQGYTGLPHLVVVVGDEPLLVRRILLSDSQLPPHSLHLDPQRICVPQPRLRQLSVAFRRSLRQHSNRLGCRHLSMKTVSAAVPYPILQSAFDLSRPLQSPDNIRPCMS